VDRYPHPAIHHYWCFITGTLPLEADNSVTFKHVSLISTRADNFAVTLAYITAIFRDLRLNLCLISFNKRVCIMKLAFPSMLSAISYLIIVEI
jgi:hypothetical protein